MRSIKLNIKAIFSTKTTDNIWKRARPHHDIFVSYNDLSLLLCWDTDLLLCWDTDIGVWYEDA